MILATPLIEADSNFHLMPEIETARLRPRMFVPSDLDDLARLLMSPEVMRYIGVEAGKTLTLEETEEHLQNFIEGWRRRRFGRWAVVEKKTNRFIGLCGLKLLEEEVELIYLLHEAYWGRGLASEAARASLRYGFEELELERIVAVTRPENISSQRVMERIGLRRAGDVRSYGVDAVCYVIERKDYEPGDALYALRRSGAES